MSNSKIIFSLIVSFFFLATNNFYFDNLLEVFEIENFLVLLGMSSLIYIFVIPILDFFLKAFRNKQNFFKRIKPTIKVKKKTLLLFLLAISFTCIAIKSDDYNIISTDFLILCGETSFFYLMLKFISNDFKLEETHI